MTQTPTRIQWETLSTVERDVLIHTQVLHQSVLVPCEGPQLATLARPVNFSPGAELAFENDAVCGVCQHLWQPDQGKHYPHLRSADIPRYSEDVGAACSLLQACYQEAEIHYLKGDTRGHYRVRLYEDSVISCAKHASLAQAICLAALRATGFLIEFTTGDDAGDDTTHAARLTGGAQPS